MPIPRVKRLVIPIQISNYYMMLGENQKAIMLFIFENFLWGIKKMTK